MNHSAVEPHTLCSTVSNLHNGIRLVDSEALACITSFCFPSAAASVQCLAWVPSAPGMFITGGTNEVLCVSVFLTDGFCAEKHWIKNIWCQDEAGIGQTAEGLLFLQLKKLNLLLKVKEAC